MVSAAPPIFDLLIVGGGINGTGIARDAAGRGLSVLLVEQGDLACATSSWSTKLIHGGLRYLEHFEFRLVGESLAEREALLAAAPRIPPFGRHGQRLFNQIEQVRPVLQRDWGGHGRKRSVGQTRLCIKAVSMR